MVRPSPVNHHALQPDPALSLQHPPAAEATSVLKAPPLHLLLRTEIPSYHWEALLIFNTISLAPDFSMEKEVSWPKLSKTENMI